MIKSLELGKRVASPLKEDQVVKNKYVLYVLSKQRRRIWYYRLFGEENGVT